MFDASLDGAVLPAGRFSAIEISKDLTIDASALTSGITIQGNGYSSIFSIDTPNPLNVSFMNLTLKGGKSTYGGAIFTSARLTMRDCTLLDNTSTSSTGGGGAIYNAGYLTLENCDLSDNSALNRGGAILNEGASLTLTNCVLSDNDATGNITTDGGGAIFNNGYHTPLVMEGCTLSVNSGYGGAIRNDQGIVTVENSTFSENYGPLGAAIFNTGGQMLVGGAYIDGGQVTMVNSTIANATDGGGIYNDKGCVATVLNCTIAGNVTNNNYLITIGGGGIHNVGTLNLGNTIVAGNKSLRGPDRTSKGR